MSVQVTVHGIGVKFSGETELSEVRTVLDAARLVCSRNHHPEYAEGRNVTYLKNGRRVLPENLLTDGDAVSVLSILCGG